MNAVRRLMFAFLWVGLLTGSLQCLAHRPSDSYLSLDLTGEKLTGQWDIGLRDLEHAVGVDLDGDGAITWGELKARQEAIARYALPRLGVVVQGRQCALRPLQHLVDHHSDGAYAVLRFGSDCPGGQPIGLDYHLFFDLDPSHRGLLRATYPQQVETAVFSPEQSRLTLGDAQRGRWHEFVDYWREGLWHIWIGFDHVLFLMALLLPAALARENGRWREASSLGVVVKEVVGIVTAFTLAHSLTLGATVVGWIGLPSRGVEIAIAATVVCAALNNLFPLVQSRRWQIAFVLGLIHGAGFASVLMDLGLTHDSLILALAGFNLGVETGQLCIVLGFLPFAYLLRGSRLYHTVVLQLGSVIVVAIAALWCLERSLNISLLPV